MTQTRGAKTFALKSSSGAMAEPEMEAVRSILATAYSDNVAGVVAEETFEILRERIVTLACSPVLVRDLEKKLAAAAKTAEKLESIIWDKDFAPVIHEMSLSPSPILLGDVAACLSRLQNFQIYFDQVDLTEAFYLPIRSIHAALGRAGLPNGVHQRSAFLRLLAEIDAHYPGTLFPPDTVEGGRINYVRRALGRMPNRSKKRA